MGYELNIKREEESQKISKKQWTDFLNSDSQFELIDEFSGELNENEMLTVSTPSAGLWKSEKGNIPFTFDEEYGEVTVKNPDNWVIEKMISIASELNAIVEGEEGEIYNESFLKNPLSKPSTSKSMSLDKKWWEIWK